MLDQLPRRALGTFPSPVRRVEVAGRTLWVKDEGEVGRLYGGNKVRKLEHVLASALEDGVTDVLTAGAAGSHHVLATALYGADVGLRVHALLVPQVESEHARANLRASAAACASVTPCSSTVAAAWVGWRRFRRLPRTRRWIPPGASNALGDAGWVRAGLEIAQAVDHGDLPEPARVYLPVGSGGTAAGLWVGLRLAGLDTEVVGIRVLPAPLGTAWVVRRHARQVMRLLRRTDPSLPVVELDGLRVDGGWLAGGYGRVDDRVRDVLSAGRDAGIALEPTYTAKALAAALADPEPARCLWIATVDHRPHPEPPPAPPELEALLTPVTDSA